MTTTDAPAPEPVPEPTPEVVAAVRSALAPLAGTMTHTLPGAVDATDPEQLHDLRIAVRQTRTILRELADLLPVDRVVAGRALFSALATATSEPRDLDVYLADWDRQLEPLAPEHHAALETVRAALEARRTQAHRRLVMVLGGTATTEGLLCWSDWLEPDPGQGPDLTPVAAEVVARVARLHRRLLRDGRAISTDSPAEDLHELRKRAKRLRYLVDCFAPLFATKPRREFLTHLKDLQDNLGAHQDAEVQVTYLRALAVEVNDGSPEATDAVLAVGRLSELVDERRVAERAAFAKRFARFDRPRTEKLLTKLLASAAR